MTAFKIEPAINYIENKHGISIYLERTNVCKYVGDEDLYLGVSVPGTVTFPEEDMSSFSEEDGGLISSNFLYLLDVDAESQGEYNKAVIDLMERAIDYSPGPDLSSLQRSIDNLMDDFFISRTAKEREIRADIANLEQRLEDVSGFPTEAPPVGPLEYPELEKIEQLWFINNDTHFGIHFVVNDLEHTSQGNIYDYGPTKVIVDFIPNVAHRKITIIADAENGRLPHESVDGVLCVTNSAKSQLVNDFKAGRMGQFFLLMLDILQTHNESDRFVQPQPELRRGA